MAEIKLDFGLNIAAPAPVDKRIVVEKLSDLYDSDNNQFKYVYAGLTVSVLNTTKSLVADEDGNEPGAEGYTDTYGYVGSDVTLWQLKDVAPYEFGTDIVLTEDNFTDYWQQVSAVNGGGEGTIYWDDLDQD